MNWLGSAVAGALGALLGCVVGLAWGAPRDARPKPEPKTARAEHVSVASQQDADELATMAERVRSLEQRVSLLTAALGAARRDGDGAAARPAGSDGAEADPMAADVADPVFEAAVRDILERIDDERRQERTTRSQKRAQLGAERASSRLAEELSLTDRQKQELFEIMKKHYESMAALRDSDDQPGTPGEWRERMQEVRRKTEEAIESHLSPAQVEKFQSLDGSEFFGGPRRLRRAAP